MAIRACWVLAVAVVVLGSCKPARSKHPLTDPKTAVADARLAGTWAGRMDDSTDVTLTFFPREGAHFDVVLLGNDGKKGAIVLAFSGFPSKVGASTWWNLRAKSFGPDYGEPVKLDDSYIFARYAVAADGTLTLWLVDEDPAAAAVKAGTLDGTVSDQGTLLTSSSEKLAAFLATPAGEKSLTPFASFKRAKVELPRPAGKPGKAK